MNDHGLASEFESIDNAGASLCARRTNPAGLDNRIVLTPFAAKRRPKTQVEGELRVAQLSVPSPASET